VRGGGCVVEGEGVKGEGWRVKGVKRGGWRVKGGG